MITSLEDFQKDVIDETNFEHFKDEEIKCIKVDEVFAKGHSIVDIIFYLRVVGVPSGSGSRKPVTKPIICTGFLPPQYLIRKDPQYAILYSPGVSYVQLPHHHDGTKSFAKLPDFDATENKDSLKPFLKLRIDKLLSEFRHSYSNLSGMLLYLLGIVKENTISNYYKKLDAFHKSLQHKLLRFFYDLDQINQGGLKKVDKELSIDKKVLLVDDMADKGWGAIVSNIIYHKFNYTQKNNFAYISKCEGESWVELIKDKIKEHKPHLLLLDLRLLGETGKHNLEDLDGYKILKHLKCHHDYKGIPVIIFSASTNAENVKKLLEMGAEAVWTKPGLDEGLDANNIVARYNKLANLIETSLLNYKDLLVNTRGTFEDLRVDFFRKLQFLNYRIKLIKDIVDNSFFNTFTDIFIDTNILMSGNFQNQADDKRFTRTALNIYALARICEKTNHDFEISNGGSTTILNGTYPKIVVHNAVMNELINLSKKYDLRYQNLWQRALLGYDMIRSLFINRYVRTEFNKFIREDGILFQELKGLKYAEEADPILIQEIKHIFGELNLRLYKYYIQYTTPNRKVLLLTDDKKLRQRASNEIESHDFDSMNITEFNKKMESILF